MCKPAALFVPSGVMANLISLQVHTQPGDEVIVGQDSHCTISEAGGGAAIAGVQFNVIPGDGRFNAGQVEPRLKRQTMHSPGTGLVWIENTHNMAGGKVFPLKDIREISALCRKRKIPLHLDGARVFNAAIASGVHVREIASYVDSLSFCLSKGLGAPVGSIVCGSSEFHTAAHRYRKRLGGAMRQAGVIAAGGIYALENHVTRLYDDHSNATRLAHGLSKLPGMEIRSEAVETNIVIVRVRPGWGTAEQLEASCREEGVLFHALDRSRIRMVTHLDVSGPEIDRAVEVIRRQLFAQRG